MPSPSIVFSFVVATLYGSSFHLVAGGDARRLALYLLAGWVGFALGQIVGDLFNFKLITIGSVYFLTATLGAYLALLSIWFLSRPNNEA